MRYRFVFGRSACFRFRQDISRTKSFRFQHGSEVHAGLKYQTAMLPILPLVGGGCVSDSITDRISSTPTRISRTRGDSESDRRCIRLCTRSDLSKRLSDLTCAQFNLAPVSSGRRRKANVNNAFTARNFTLNLLPSQTLKPTNFSPTDGRDLRHLQPRKAANKPALK